MSSAMNIRVLLVAADEGEVYMLHDALSRQAATRSALTTFALRRRRSPSCRPSHLNSRSSISTRTPQTTLRTCG